MKKMNIGISSCLLGNKVRYDGSHKKNRIANGELSKYFEYKAFCPEVGIGLGIPRPTIRLVQEEDMIEVINPDTKESFTQALKGFAHKSMSSIEELDGFLFKKDSPSCGAFRVKTYHTNGNRLHSDGIGAFAEEVMNRFPNMPIEEEGRLNDVGLKNNFIYRTMIYKELKEVSTIKELIDFHSEHKFSIYSYGQYLVKELGQIIASNKKDSDFKEIKELYMKFIMQKTIKPPKKGNQVNAMLHVLGYLKNELKQKEKAEVLRLIEMYNNNETSIMTPLSVIKFLIKNNGNEYIKKQSYMKMELQH